MKEMMTMHHLIIPCLVLFLTFAACTGSSDQDPTGQEGPQPDMVEEGPFFSLVPPEHSAIFFKNGLAENSRINPYTYINSYGGGGVAIGDINNDGWADIYLTGNNVIDRLFLNQGDMKFLDITHHAGTTGGDGWSSGVTMADVNGDGFLDIYISRGYDFADDWLRANILYINNGDFTFTNKAEEYGLADAGLSVQSTFFDYDLDGDLDLYVGNHPWDYNIDMNYSMSNMKNPQMKNSDHLYRNNGDGTFTNVTRAAGILNHGFLLGLVIGDYDNDGWPDIYVANDHVEPDKFYRNNGDGTFSNVIDEALKHTCKFAMGVDMADFNNDGHLDIVNVDMMAPDNFRQKSQMASMQPKTFWRLVEEGYGYQYMRNALHVNCGNGKFIEVGQYAGISKTDWSWASLFADFDNDGDKDLFISNGFRSNIKDNDFLLTLDKENEAREKANKRPLTKTDFAERAKGLTSTKLANFYYQNDGNYKFSSKGKEYGLGLPGFSNGASYADLDNDGDLDLVINNLDAVASVYQNHSHEKFGNNAFRIKLMGEGNNRHGLGAKVTLKVGDKVQYQELTLTRGYQSSVEPILHFGIGKATMIDEVIIEWPDGQTSILTDQAGNQIVEVHQKDAIKERIPKEKQETYFKELPAVQTANFVHKEKPYDDYAKEILLPHRMSQFGPALAVGDINNDGFEDFYIGGAAGQSGALYIGIDGTGYRRAKGAPWGKDVKYEDIGALFFDADQDGDQDLYVVSGSNEFPEGHANHQDRLYLNQGDGKFINGTEHLPSMRYSGSMVVASDYDNDGDLDLFVGGRQKPGAYPFPGKSFLLRNDNGKFSDVTQEVAPELERAGMVTSAVWTDFNGDGQTDLIVVGEWMPVSFYKNENGKLSQVDSEFGLGNTVGWWNRIAAGDFDNDGDIDLVVGNLGLNYKYHASASEPFHIYCHDFDNNGSLDIVLGQFNAGICYPVRGRQCSSEQMPMISQKFETFKAFAQANLRDIYGEQLDAALHYAVTTFESSYFENTGGGTFHRTALPTEAQFSTVNGIIPYDYNGDGNLDILIAGNLYVAEVETGRADAGTGLLMLGNGNGDFETVHYVESGFFADLDVKDIRMIDGEKEPRVIVANNNDAIQIFALESITPGDANSLQ